MMRTLPVQLPWRSGNSEIQRTVISKMKLICPQDHIGPIASRAKIRGGKLTHELRQNLPALVNDKIRAPVPPRQRRRQPGGPATITRVGAQITGMKHESVQQDRHDLPMVFNIF